MLDWDRRNLRKIRAHRMPGKRDYFARRLQGE